MSNTRFRITMPLDAAQLSLAVILHFYEGLTRPRTATADLISTASMISNDLRATYGDRLRYDASWIDPEICRGILILAMELHRLLYLEETAVPGSIERKRHQARYLGDLIANCDPNGDIIRLFRSSLGQMSIGK